jgi:hypothetical protein
VSSSRTGVAMGMSHSLSGASRRIRNLKPAWREAHGWNCRSELLSSTNTRKIVSDIPILKEAKAECEAAIVEAGLCRLQG